MNGPLIVIGDSLLDVDLEGDSERLCPDAPVPVVDGHIEHRRPGGAGLAALLAAQDGARVILVTAIGDDAAGRCLADLLSAYVEVVRLPLHGLTVRKTRIRVRGQTLLRVDTGDGRAHTCEAGFCLTPLGSGGYIVKNTASQGGKDPGECAVGEGVSTYANPGMAAWSDAGPSESARRKSGVNGEADHGRVGDAVVAALKSASAILVSDYGKGVADLCRGLLDDIEVPVIWDPHPRGGPPARGCTLVTPSEAEAEAMCGGQHVSPERAVRRLVRELDVESVAVTLGGDGAVLSRRGNRSSRFRPHRMVSGQDTCGAGDRFAVSAALALGKGCAAEEAVKGAVEDAAGFVERGGAAAVRLDAVAPRDLVDPPETHDLRTTRDRPPRGEHLQNERVGGGRVSTPIGAPQAMPDVRGDNALSKGLGTDLECLGASFRTSESATTNAASPLSSAADVLHQVRAEGGRVVATGGCFDLLHAGHLSLLRRARALGDALIVCVNSDASVRQLKGNSRPIVKEQHRSEMLCALCCVDAVLIFHETTPCEVIERIRPDVWVKGGDYHDQGLPEAPIVGAVGGEIVILPCLPGHSTTKLIAAVQAAR
ncbi:PfkB family carbohydrate kinase [Sinosporangium siamense]|uniref:D-glycero-beta-D-manno-heptose 1-phosphate adenylyltransferase n=1 Tax=Sinosporangium siamense TaxID=1367973 RepID=A0A919RIM1_9ACTN|nr:PfkB family carbohydrate kinase [Sinosporangium siamense]GII94498.1 hypothetical protein Ssi02_47290 [Sinosporangium siamense]